MQKYHDMSLIAHQDIEQAPKYLMFKYVNFKSSSDAEFESVKLQVSSENSDLKQTRQMNHLNFI